MTIERNDVSVKKGKNSTYTHIQHTTAERSREKKSYTQMPIIIYEYMISVSRINLFLIRFWDNENVRYITWK